MSPLIETLRLWEGKVDNLAYHQMRMAKSLDALLGQKQILDLSLFLKKYFLPNQGLFKCRIIYTSNEFDAGIDIVPYSVKPVSTLRIVRNDDIEYEHKFENRQALDKLFKQRKDCDDVLIVKNGLLTDTSYANIIFRRGDEWITPTSCLLKGTQRQFLLDQKIIKEEEVRLENIADFTSFKLINSMLLFNSDEVSVGNIKD